MTERTEKQVKAVIDRFVKEKPKNRSDLEKMGLKLGLIGNGLYREVYRINGLPLVVKLSKNAGSSPRDHARAEYRAVRRIQRFKKYAQLRKYMPEIHYFDSKTGVMLMHYYKPLPKGYRCIARLLDHIIELTWPYAAESECDVHGGNVGLGENNQPILIDMGYFSQLGKGSW